MQFYNTNKSEGCKYIGSHNLTKQPKLGISKVCK